MAKIRPGITKIMTRTVTFRSTAAYPQMYYMLEHREFKQRHMARDLDIPYGLRINGFVNWLVERKFVGKIRDRKHEINAYRVIAPVALIKFFSAFRNMKTRAVSKDMGKNRDEVIKYLKDNGAVFCLTTALEHYTDYVRDPAINVYVDEKFLDEMQQKETSGSVRVNMHPFDLYRENNIIEKDSMRITTKIRTLIDLYCDDKAYMAEPLIRQLWS